MSLGTTAALICFSVIGLFFAALIIFNRIFAGKIQKFYASNSLLPAPDPPPEILKAINAAGVAWRESSLLTASGDPVKFYWWEWAVVSSSLAGGTRIKTAQSFLAVSFPPNAVSTEFERKVLESGEQKNKNFALNAAVFFSDSIESLRAEIAANHSFLIVWQISPNVTVYQKRLNWLKNNVVRN